MKENQASSTAFTALQSVLYTARYSPYKHLVSAEVIAVGEQILATSREGKKRLKQLHSPRFHLANFLLEQLLMPNIRLHIMLRKRFIEDITVEAIQNGITQVVNLGAGFDTLMWRLHSKHPNVNFIELDHPATSTLKTHALVQPDLSASSNLHFIAIDFSKQDLRSTLQGCPGFSTTRKTLFICEAVLMYLELNDVLDLLGHLKALSSEESLLILSCVEPMDSPNNDTSPLLKIYLKLKNETLNWCIERQHLASFLNNQRYQLIEMADAETFNIRYLGSQNQHKLHQSEYIAVAQIN